MRRLYIKKFFLLLCLLLFFPRSDVFASDTEYLITPANSKIGFKLNSTFHMVHGNAVKFEGKIRVPNPFEPMKLFTEVKMLVDAMETANEKRDKKMRNYCLEMDKFPEIRFRSTGFREFSTSPNKNGHFEFTMEGDLTIKDITKNIAIPVEVVNRGGGTGLSGKVTLNYIKDFKIKDPSMFIFRVAKEVEVFFEIDMPHLSFAKLRPAFRNPEKIKSHNSRPSSGNLWQVLIRQTINVGPATPQVRLNRIYQILPKPTRDLGDFIFSGFLTSPPSNIRDNKP